LGMHFFFKSRYHVIKQNLINKILLKQNKNVSTASDDNQIKICK
jgi:hypothetical protein